MLGLSNIANLLPTCSKLHKFWSDHHYTKSKVVSVTVHLCMAASDCQDFWEKHKHYGELIFIF